ncbi:hypothetical protein OB905_13725 [Halobacteria archaeon AArc-dxtr1]|nr:hypothetical protein [Halobacteria archaeon AArc-dxtr1]
MTDDATLSDFASSRDDEGEPCEDEGPSEETESADGVPADVKEPSPTYAWGEYACTACGERTERVWYRDSEPHCPACTDWD